MKHITILLLGLSIVKAICGQALAAEVLITKPAGELPLSNHSNIDQTLDMPDEPTPKKIGTAKSRVIPASKMAVAEQPKRDIKVDSAPRMIAITPKKSQDMRRIAAGEKKSSVEPSKLDKPTESTQSASDQTAHKKARVREVMPKDTLPKEEIKVLSAEDIMEQSEPFRFSGKDKADPFIPPLGSIQSKKELKDLSADEIPIVSPLQYFALNQLVVTGVWQGADNQWKAMIETPDQQGVIVQSGDPIGSSGGHVANIGANGVKVRQYKLQRDGARIYSESVIGMAPEIAEKPEAGGTIILKPGVERPEIQLPGPDVELDENGNPKETNSTRKRSSAASKEVLIGPDKGINKIANVDPADLPVEMPQVGHEGAEKMVTISPDTAAPIPTPQPAVSTSSPLPTLIPNILPPGDSL